MHKLPKTRSCFVCGVGNPAGLKLEMQTDGRRVETVWRPRPEHTGFQETVHGGLISTVLDELMVWACVVATRQLCYCAELQVRFRHPVRPGQSTRVEAELADDRRGRLFLARAKLVDEQARVLAESEGKYLPIGEGAKAAFLGDVLGDFGTVWPE